MLNPQLMERITIDPAVMVGRPVIRGTRLTVEYILGLMANGATTEEILDEYSGLVADDISACFFFAANSLSHSDYFPVVERA